MKKILCALLASLMVLSFAGCKIESTADADTDKPAVEQPADETPDEEPVVDEPVEEEPVEEEPVEEVASTFTPGEINGNVYTNEYADITFTAPDDMVYSSEDELAEMMDISVELITDNEYVQKLAELGTVFDMMAQDDAQTKAVQVMFENTAITGAKNISAEDYLDVVSAQVVNTYSSFDLPMDVSDPTNVKIGANDYLLVTITIDLSDMGGEALEQCYACRKIDKYMACIVLTADTAGGTDELLACFS